MVERQPTNIHPLETRTAAVLITVKAVPLHGSPPSLLIYNFRAQASVGPNAASGQIAWKSNTIYFMI